MRHQVTGKASQCKGLEAANNGENENAARLLQYGLTALLQEEPVKFMDVKDAVNRIVGCYAEIPSMQWIEWGATAKQKNIPEAAIALLEKGIAKETDARLLRRAHFDIGELRIQTKSDVNAAIVFLDDLGQVLHSGVHIGLCLDAELTNIKMGAA